jgi:hypothetical protein
MWVEAVDADADLEKANVVGERKVVARAGWQPVGG